MAKFFVHKPKKNAIRYEFTVTTDCGQKVPFGFHSINFEIEHHEIWDSIYPLMFLTRNGGPIYNKLPENEAIIISFGYPVIAEVAAYYVRRARDFGYAIEIDGALSTASYEIQTTGDVLAFGGGKDSRLLLGVLRDAGIDPKLVVAGEGFSDDLPAAFKVRPINGAMPDRLIPGLMRFPSRFYIGSGLGEVHRTFPWQQYYDVSSPVALEEFGLLLGRLGADLRFIPGVCVLPYNLAQHILFQRYPDLFRHQVSTRADQLSDKNLHVSLLKAYHGIDFSSHLSREAFVLLAKRFIEGQTKDVAGGVHGFRGHREVINREMRSILCYLRDQSRVQFDVPEHWEVERWIDYVHPYAFPGVPVRFLEIFREYADLMTVQESGLTRFF